MNPAPPETTALGRDALLAANAAIGETQVPHSCRLIDVAPIHDDRPTHQPVYARHVELPELIPFRDKDKSVGAGRYGVRILHVLNLGQGPVEDLLLEGRFLSLDVPEEGLIDADGDKDQMPA